MHYLKSAIPFLIKKQKVEIREDFQKNEISTKNPPCISYKHPLSVSGKQNTEFAISS